MKGRKFIFLIGTLCLFCMTSCVHTRGNIGHWFGQWKLTQITINEEPDATYNGTVFWSFQSDMILMLELGKGEGRGTWEEDGDNLILTFTYQDDFNPPGSLYLPVPATHLPAGVSTLRILKSPGTKMELEYVSPEGDKYQYSLSKWW